MYTVRCLVLARIGNDTNNHGKIARSSFSLATIALFTFFSYLSSILFETVPIFHQIRHVWCCLLVHAEDKRQCHPLRLKLRSPWYGRLTQHHGQFFVTAVLSSGSALNTIDTVFSHKNGIRHKISAARRAVLYLLRRTNSCTKDNGIFAFSRWRRHVHLT